MAQWEMFGGNRQVTACGTGTSQSIRYRSNGAAVVLVRDNDRVAQGDGRRQAIEQVRAAVNDQCKRHVALVRLRSALGNLVDGRVRHPVPFRSPV